MGDRKVVLGIHRGLDVAANDARGSPVARHRARVRVCRRKLRVVLALQLLLELPELPYLLPQSLDLLPQAFCLAFGVGRLRPICRLHRLQTVLNALLDLLHASVVDGGRDPLLFGGEEAAFTHVAVWDGTDEARAPLKGPLGWMDARSPGSSERVVRIEPCWGLGIVIYELVAPSLLRGRAVHHPELFAQGMQALEHGQRLLGRPVGGKPRRWRIAPLHGLPRPVAALPERCLARAASRSCASLAR